MFKDSKIVKAQKTLDRDRLGRHERAGAKMEKPIDGMDLFKSYSEMMKARKEKSDGDK